MQYLYYKFKVGRKTIFIEAESKEKALEILNKRMRITEPINDVPLSKKEKSLISKNRILPKFSTNPQRDLFKEAMVTDIQTRIDKLFTKGWELRGQQKRITDVYWSIRNLILRNNLANHIIDDRIELTLLNRLDSFIVGFTQPEMKVISNSLFSEGDEDNIKLTSVRVSLDETKEIYHKKFYATEDSRSLPIYLNYGKDV